MKKILYSSIFAMVFATACKKDDVTTKTTDVETIKKEIATNFSSNIALPAYADLEAKSQDLQTSLQTLETTPTDANLETAKQNWKGLRAIWETSEGFLFGPVEDNEYDPQSDTWPTDYAQIDSLLADTSNHLTLPEVQSLDYTLRGYHPIEYMLWGISGNKHAADLTAREKKYIHTLAEDLNNICSSLSNDWKNGFAAQVSNAGTAASATYPKYINLFTDINNSMVAICEEVGEGKMLEPFVLPGDSSIVESPYSENSMTDFKNNIQGAYNVYLGKYTTRKTGMTDLVQAYNKDLDNRIKQKFEAAINSFSTVNVSFEKAIFIQRVQLQNIMNAIGGAKDILDTELKTLLVNNVKN